ncbi:hypothetical protein RSAG8_00163, partial [Rhizoctonia solani AG-8 WAC10335]
MLATRSTRSFRPRSFQRSTGARPCRDSPSRPWTSGE